MDVQEFIREVSRSFHDHLQSEVSYLMCSLQVDWTEPWLLGLLGFHITTAVAVVLLRKHHYAQACILAVLGRRRREFTSSSSGGDG